MLLSDVVSTSDRVAATRSRSAKIAALADLLGRLTAAEIEPAIGFVAGEPRQGKSGVGWATIFGVERGAGARRPSLTVTDLDLAIAAARRLRRRRLGRRAPAAAGRPARPGHGGRGRLHPAADSRRAAPGRAGGGGDRRGGQGRRRARSMPCGGRPCWPATCPGSARVALSEGEAGAGRGRPRGAPARPADAGLDRGRRGRGHGRPWACRRSSGSWTAPGSRPIASATEVRLFTRNLQRRDRPACPALSPRYPSAARRVSSCSTARCWASATTSGPTCSRTP